MTLTWDDFLTGEGNSSNGLPAGYTQVEYLESTGSQYIDTGYCPCWDSEISGTLQETSNHSSQTFFSTVAQKSTQDRAIWQDSYFFTTYPSSYEYGWLVFGNSIEGLASAELRSSVNSKTEVFESKEKITVNGKTTDFYPVEPTNFRTPYALYLFGRNYQNHAELFAYARIFAFSLSEKGVPKRNFVPCLDRTGAPCMFDMVTRKTFYNLGSGDFLYPTSRTTYALRRVLPDWGKLTQNGLSRLYHAPANYTGELYDYAVENGYKPIVEPEKPEEGYWSPQWRETAEEIVLDWVETEPPSDEFGLTNVEQEEIK